MIYHEFDVFIGFVLDAPKIDETPSSANYHLAHTKKHPVFVCFRSVKVKAHTIIFGWIKHWIASVYTLVNGLGRYHLLS